MNIYDIGTADLCALRHRKTSIDIKRRYFVELGECHKCSWELHCKEYLRFVQKELNKPTLKGVNYG